LNIERYRKSIEKMYKDRCDITTQVESGNGGSMGGVGFKPDHIVKDHPCRLSYDNNTPVVSMNDINGVIKQTPKLFIAPNIVVPAGCEITVYSGGRKFEFKNTSEPVFRETHQEITLDKAEKRS
jgi:hypothetical protein